MYGLELHAPEGKLPGFYAQAVHKIGETVQVFDRDQQMLIVASPAERDQLRTILEKYQMAGEEISLWHLGEMDETAAIQDYGFVSLAGHAYLYADQTAFFQFNESVGSAQDRWAALTQMQEHLLASLTSEAGTSLHAAAEHDRDLIDGIARAYQVEVIWLEDLSS